MAVTKFPADYPKKIDAKKVERAKKEKRFKGGEKICRSATGIGRRDSGGRRLVSRGVGGDDSDELGTISLACHGRERAKTDADANGAVFPLSVRPLSQTVTQA